MQTLSPDTQIEHVSEQIESSSTIPGSFLEDGQQQNESTTAMANILDQLNDVDLTKDAHASEFNSELHESTGFNSIKEKVIDQDTLATAQQTASQPVTPQQSTATQPVTPEQPTSNTVQNNTPITQRRVSKCANKGYFSQRFDDIIWGNKGNYADMAVTGENYGLTLSAVECLKAYKIKIPQSYNEALQSPQANKWKEAMENQLNKLTARHTWDLIPQPHGVKPLPGKWVYDLKQDSNANILEFRVQWVICGNFQRPGIDFDDVYAPVASEAAIKIILLIITTLNLECEQFNIITAYLNTALKKHKVFM